MARHQEFLSRRKRVFAYKRVDEHCGHLKSPFPSSSGRSANKLKNYRSFKSMSQSICHNLSGVEMRFRKLPGSVAVLFVVPVDVLEGS
jgi:hypothetical protein